MKRFLLILALLSAFSAGAQNPRPKDFAAASDSLRIQMHRRTGVDVDFRLEKVLVRGNELDFYFSQNLTGYPWRQQDVRWFREQWAREGKDALKGRSVGILYAKRQPLDELAMPALTNDGQPIPTPFKVADPAGKTPPLVQGGPSWPKGLRGRHIALWQSHGYYWEGSENRWEWQRAPVHGTVEDLYTQSYVIPFLIPMLENAGAVVLNPRERDPQPREVVCDNDPAFSGTRPENMRQQGRYSEKGWWESAGEGFADARAAYKEGENPFRMGTARKSQTCRSNDDPSQQSKAVWRPNLPEKGPYAVYVSYKTLPNSTSQARYTVHHLGGKSVLHVNQRMGGGTWVYLGTFLFDKGTEGYVELSNVSESQGVVTADAVRFGGGMGKQERAGGTSGLPAYTEAALYNYAYSGLDWSLLDDWEGDYLKDIGAHGTWVNELCKKGVPIDLSLAFHSDAGVTPNDSIVGTLALYTLRRDGRTELPDGSSRLSGRLLGELVQSQVVEDLRAGFEPEWTRRELLDRSYSECRVPEVPSMILEILSHQNFADMRLGLDPSFRFTVARAVYKGILKFLSARYGCPYAVQPLPVHGFRVKEEKGQAILSWMPTADPAEPTASASYYKVYTRRDDGGFGEGLQISGTSCTLSLEKGHLYSYRITACNAGGESFPSEILCVGIPEKEGRKVQIVNNFTRVSAPGWFDTPAYAGFLYRQESGVPWGTDLHYSGEVNQYDRSREWTDDDNPGFGGSYTDQAGSRIAGNTFDFAAVHGQALLKAGYAVESCSAEAFDGASGAWAVDLICGKQLTTRVGRGAVPDRYSVFPEALQAALRQHTAAGGHVLLSGAYIGTDAWETLYPGVAKAPESTRDFVKQVLGYQWVTNFGDNSGRVYPVPDSPLPAATYNRNGSPLLYRVENPDGIKPAAKQARLLLRYQGSNVPAATFFDAGTYRVAAFGFPLETSAQLEEIVKTVLGLF